MAVLFGIVGFFETKRATDALGKLSHREREKSMTSHSSRHFFQYHASLDKIFVSFDGMLENAKALSVELDTIYQSDAQIVLLAYKKWAKDFILHLRGAFSIAIMDDDTLYLFRDRFGRKPLFYLETKDSFIFASEIKALTLFLDRVLLNEDALISYLSFLAPTPPHTFFKDIYKLAAAQRLEFDGTASKVSTYYEILDTKPSIICDEEEAVTKLEEILNRSVLDSIDDSRQTAALLSGGIDSATISYFLKENNKNIETYTIGYREFAKYDEREDARESARLLGVTNHHKEIDQEEFLSACHEVFEALDEPLNDPAATPLYILMRSIKDDGHEVLLSGEGSDELFLGYRHYKEYLDIEQASLLLHKNWLKKYFRSNFSNHREWEWYKRIFDEKLLFRTSGEKFTDLQKNALMRRNIKDNDSMKYLEKYRDKFEQSLHVDNSIWYSYIDLNLFQSEHFLTKLDRVSFAHGIESRTPFLNQNLVETIFAIEPKLRYKSHETKRLLKEVMRDRLDDKILKRKKRGFSNPFIEYLSLSNKLSLIEEVNNQTGLFDKEALKKYLNLATKGSFKQHVWGLYTLSVWIKKYLL